MNHVLKIFGNYLHVNLPITVVEIFKSDEVRLCGSFYKCNAVCILHPVAHCFHRLSFESQGCKCMSGGCGIIISIVGVTLYELLLYKKCMSGGCGIIGIVVV